MNRYIEILDETVTRIENDPRAVDFPKTHSIPIVFDGWSYSIDLKEEKTSLLGKDVMMVENPNGYLNSMSRTMFKMRFLAPAKNSVRNWTIECLSTLKDDSIQMESLKADQISFGLYSFRFKNNIVTIERDAEERFSTVKMNWFQNETHRIQCTYRGTDLKECVADFFSNQLQDMFFEFPDAIRDLIIGRKP